MPPPLSSSQYLHQTLALHSALHAHKAAMLHADNESPRSVAFVKGVLNVRRRAMASFKRFLDAGREVLRDDIAGTLAPLETILAASAFARIVRLDMFDQRCFRPSADIEARVDRLRLFTLAESLALTAWRKQLGTVHFEINGQPAHAVDAATVAVDYTPTPVWISVDDLPLPSLAPELVSSIADARTASAAAVFAASLEAVSLCQEVRIWVGEGSLQTTFGLTSHDSAGIWNLFAAHAAAMPPAFIVRALAAASRLRLEDMPSALNDQLALRLCREHSACSAEELAGAIRYLSAW